MGAVEVVNRAVKLAKALRDVAELARDAETKNVIADLNLTLADLKERIAALQEENLELKAKLQNQGTVQNIRDNIEVENGAYWLGESASDGRLPGPYCTACFDTQGRLVLLTELQPPFTTFGKYRCGACQNNAGDANIPGRTSRSTRPSPSARAG